MRKWFYQIRSQGLFNFLCGVGNEIQPPKAKPKSKISASLTKNVVLMQERLKGTSDFNVRELEIGGVKVNIFTNEGMTNIQTVNDSLIRLTESFKERDDATGEEIYQFIETKMLFAAEMKDIYTFEDLFKMMMSGFLIVLIDGVDHAISMGAQGFQFRSISEPSGEINIRGSREGFTEPIKINMSMIRRRVKSEALHFEMLKVGNTGQTDVCLAYLDDVASPKLLKNIKYQLSKIDFSLILNSGYIQPFLESVQGSFFSDVGYTERPDTVCAKIYEGRVAVLVDGTPFALIVPYLFSENFQSIDDYNHKPYYATAVRFLKYISFAVTILLPGLYVAIGTFHPELFPPALLFNIVSSQETTPFPMVIEALVIHFIYEVMREAGLRLPRPVGHAISIVGSLVIGDAAVTAGLIGSPMVMVVALTAISSFVVPSLQEPAAVLKFGFIIIGGTMGLYGIALGAAVVLVNASALTAFGVPYLSPIAPFSLYAMRDTFVRSGIKTLQKKDNQVDELNGIHIGRQD
ncbi:Bacillus/Clostridium GerA spore germination protein [uncultured Ruminococcus sp.]|nr:spore germination protein [Massiliimalia timonensis]SCH07221.1 Bacillus/Clostridium GerA spore germination protein [uncultured Ruminococcus sp.]SCH76456.1 Bacillus/Clostridium GerA spore germination protein [uncultured Clostridium sp.]